MKISKAVGLYLVFISIAFFLFGSASQVDAMPLLRLYSGNPTTNAEVSIPVLASLDDGGVYDTTGNGDGVITINGISVPPAPAAAWNFGGIVSQVANPLGSAFPNTIRGSGFISSASTTEGTMTVVFYDEFNATNATRIQGNSLLSLGFNKNGRVVMEAWLGKAGDTNWLNGDQIALFDTNNASPYNSIFDFMPASPLTDYSITVVATITHYKGGGMTMINRAEVGSSVTATAISAVPEPATLALLGIGLAGLCGGGYIRRRKIKNIK